MMHVYILRVAVLVALAVLAGCGSGGEPTTTQLDKPTLRRMFGPSSEPQPKPGAPKVRVPDLVGFPSTRGARKLRERGLFVIEHFPGPIGNPDLKPLCGYTYSHQSPPAGERIPVGSTVAVVPNLCPEFSRPPARRKSPN